MKKILVVDDEAGFGRLLKLNLERTGQYEVQLQFRGSHALAAATQYKPDLIIMDVVMPDVSGITVAKALEDSPELSGIPIIFLTATVSREDVVANGGLINGHRSLAKPVGLEEVIACIESCLSPA